MQKLDSIYEKAVEHTKNKVLQDMKQYLQKIETWPSLSAYEKERGHYLERIWVDVWVNLASNGVPRAAKKQFLSNKGYEVEGVAKKLLNKQFRDEIKNYKPFNIRQWLDVHFAQKPERWAQLYSEAKEERQRQLEIETYQKKRLECQEKMEAIMGEFMFKQRHFLYLKARKMLADQLKHDLETKSKYESTEFNNIQEPLVSSGSFKKQDYFTAGDFFYELTGNVYREWNWNQYHYFYETYDEKYEGEIYRHLSRALPEKVKGFIPDEVLSQYDHELLELVLDELCHDYLDDFVEDVMVQLQDELLDDLLALAEVPFTEEVHSAIFFSDMKQREQRIAEERARIQREKEEEARRLKEIFELEYNPPRERKIRYILHIGETNTGKTFQALQKMKQAPSGLYLAPLRLLALEVFEFLNDAGTPCSLKTGEEEKIIPDARHLSCTVEMFHEREFFHVVVIDEAQMISDKDRGFSWYKAITKVQAEEVHIIASLNARHLLTELLGDAEVEVIEYKREIPLDVEKKKFTLKQAKKGDALICFSRKKVLETASRLQNEGKTVSMIYGSMPPETRKKQVLRFINGEADIIVATDAIGMGLNLPIRRIVFLENQKFDGTKRRTLTSQEVKQIAGRAGRKGMYPIGKVAFTEDIKKMERLLLQQDEPLRTFTIAPTPQIFARFQKYYRDLETFFILWNKFNNPKGTKKASLTEERELYRYIRGTELEARLSLTDLYGLLHLPFSTREPELIKQWKKTVEAIAARKDLPEPKVKKRTLEELELSYKAIGLHLLFLYRLNQRTSALYWERIRSEISDLVHEKLKTEVKKMTKRCRSCNRALPWKHPYAICDSCYGSRYGDMG